MTEQEKRLVAALTVLRDNLSPVVEDLLAGQLDAEGRTLVAKTLRAIADDLDRLPTSQP
jgi:hypothetical protein